MLKNARPGVLVGLLLVLLASPWLVHYALLTTRYSSNQEKWERNGSASYEIVVANNSLSAPTGGINTIRVEDGTIVKAENPECADCSASDFNAYTVKALFDLIEEECIRGFPFTLCNLAYDQDLGFPRRMDFYPYGHWDERLPSLTVSSIHVLP